LTQAKRTSRKVRLARCLDDVVVAVQCLARAEARGLANLAEARAAVLTAKGNVLAECLADILQDTAWRKPRKPAGGKEDLDEADAGVAELPDAEADVAQQYPTSPAADAVPVAQGGPPAAAEAVGQGLGQPVESEGPGWAL
jgi:hypothetical protein